MSSAKHYLICTTPRTGSSMFCSLLAGTGAAGMRRGGIVGQEYLLELVGRKVHRVDVGRLDRDRLRRHLRDAFERSRSANGVAGFKIMWAQIAALARRLGCATGRDGFGFHDFAELLPPGTRFVWLTRRDRLRQAVSLEKAVQSRCWNSAEQERFAGRYVFDYVGLVRTVNLLERHDQMWGEFFDRNAVTPLEVAYEDVIEDRGAEVRRILDFLEVPPGEASEIGDVHYKQQSDAVNDRWAERFARIRAFPPVVRAAYAVWFTPRWLALRALSLRRERRRVRLLPSGERVLPRSR